MSFELSADRCRQALKDHTERLAHGVSIAGGAGPVPTCPDWTVTNLVEHVGQTQRWVSEIVERRITDPAQLPTEMAVLPAEPQAWTAWLSGGVTRAAAACSDAALYAAVFNPAGDERTGARFWLHSLLNETVIHGADAAAAAGQGYDIDADIALELVTNHLAMLTSPAWAAQRSDQAAALAGTGETLHFQATDEPRPGESVDWFVERHPDGIRWQHRHDTVDVTVHGPAASLLLVLTRRRPLPNGRANDLRIDGDIELVRHWIDNSARDLVARNRGACDQRVP